MRNRILWVVVVGMLAVACSNEGDVGDAGSSAATDTVGQAGGPLPSDTSTREDVREFGSIRWSFSLPGGPNGQEAADRILAVGEDGTVYVLAAPFGGGDRLYAIGSDGAQRWVFDGLPTAWGAGCAGVVLSTATDTLYLPCVDVDGDQNLGRVFAVSAVDGELRWTFDLPAGDLPRDAALRSYGTPPKDTLYLTTVIPQPAPDHPLYLYSVTSEGAAGPSTEGEGGFLGLAIDAASNVYTTTPDGALLGLDPDLRPRWRLELPAGTPVGALAVGPGGRRYVGVTAPSGLYAVDLDPDQGGLVERWFYASASGVGQPWFASDGSVLLVDMARGLVALDPDDGSERWLESGTASGFYQGAAVADGAVFYTLDYALFGRSAQGVNLFVDTSIVNANPPAIGSDGTIFAAGRCEGGSNVNNCVFAIRGPAPPAQGWFRGSGDNGNRRWAGD